MRAVLGAGVLTACVTVASGQATTNPAPAATRPAPATEKYTGPAREGWWNDAVFYEVFVRSFADSTKGPLAGDGIGDLRGLIERLDYLNDGDPKTDTDLGVTALWLMPVTQSPSYHGYDTTDYKAVNDKYGTAEDFKQFMAECHKRGIKVVIDLVLNHCSDKHPWFQAAKDKNDPKHDWFIWEEKRPEWKGPWNQTVWHPLSPARGRGGGDANVGAGLGPWYYGCFGRNMPDLNYANPAVTAEMRGVVHYWLDDLGVDGFRLDAIRHLIEDGEHQDNTPQTHAWLREFYTDYKKRKPEAFVVGEVWSSTDVISTYVGDQMDTAFEFQLAAAIMEAVNKGDTNTLAETLQRTWTSFPRNQFATFLTNHDQARVMTEFKGDEGKARLAAGLLMTLPGVPFVYYGEELGMSGPKPDEKIRTPMQWEPGAGAGFTTGKPWQAPNADTTVKNVKAESGEAGSLLNSYRKMIRLRQQTPALRRGDFELIPTGSDHVLAFVRREGVQRVLVVANVGAEATGNYQLQWPAGHKPVDGTAKDLATAKPAAWKDGSLGELPAQSVLVLELK